MEKTTSVSRETLEDLNHLHDLLLKWNAKINLVSKSSAFDLWHRHIWDSAQISDYMPVSGVWVDIGSGGGFPGLVVAILSKNARNACHFILVESDQRKSAFLRTAIRELGLPAEVKTNRIEALPSVKADVLSARALADLDQLLGFAHLHLAKTGTALFLKGERWENEVEVARKTWSFDLNVHQSKTSPEAAILEIKEIERG